MAFFIGDGMRVGRNRVTHVAVDVERTAKLLFARHIHSLLRTFAFSVSSQGNVGEGERSYRVTFITGSACEVQNVPGFIGWSMTQDDPITEVWTAIGTEGDLALGTSRGNPSVEQLQALGTKLEDLVANAERLANSATLWTFDVAYRLDAGQPLYPHSPLEFGDTIVVTLPREEDAPIKGWGHNPGLGVMLQTLATDSEDAIDAGVIPLNDRILFWTFLSASYLWKTKSLFAVPANWEESKKRIIDMSVPTEHARGFQQYSRVDAKSALDSAPRLWNATKSRGGEQRIRMLSALAAFRTALEIQTRTQYSLALAIVAHVAALEAMYGPPEQCPGQLSCALGHPLTLKHDLVGHRQKVLRGIRAAMGETRSHEWERLLNRAYANYRSAYVHSASTPLDEYEEKSELLNLQDTRRFWKGREETMLIFKLERLVREALQ